jgi:hypothetical protein
VERLFFPHCQLEPAWSVFAFAVDVSAEYAVKQRALTEYGSIFRVQEEDCLLQLYEAEDAPMGRPIGVAHAETFHAARPLAVADPTVFLPGVRA